MFNLQLEKTNVIMVLKGKVPRKGQRCYYMDKELEQISKFNYLGEYFSEKGIFEEAAK